MTIANKKSGNIIIPIIYSIACMTYIFSPFIPTGIMDELVVLLLGIFGYRYIFKCREFVIIVLFLFFFLGYSLLIGINRWEAVFFDFLLFLKPFISFFVPLSMPFILTNRLRERFKKIFFLCCIYCIIQIPFVNQIYDNNSAYYVCCIVSSISYLFFSSCTRKDFVFSTIVLCMGLSTFKAKFITEFIFFVFVVFFLRSKIRLNIKWIFLIVAIALISIYFNYEKFSIYFYAGSEDGISRTMFYYKSIDVLRDYFPLGSGFSTYGTEAAAQFYSPLYHKYGFDSFWGTMEVDYKTDHDFLHDTFYPVLAQFGIVGVVLYIIFWKRRWNEGSQLNGNLYKLFLFVFFVIFIQNLADNAFTSATGVSLMMLLAMLISKKEEGKQL